MKSGFGYDIPKVLMAVGLFGAMTLITLILAWLSPRGVECRRALTKGVEAAVDSTIQRAGSDYVIVMTEQGRRLWEAEPALEAAIREVYEKNPETLPGFSALPTAQELSMNGHSIHDIAKRHNVGEQVILALIMARACEIYYKDKTDNSLTKLSQ